MLSHAWKGFCRFLRYLFTVGPMETIRRTTRYLFAVCSGLPIEDVQYISGLRQENESLRNAIADVHGQIGHAARTRDRTDPHLLQFAESIEALAGLDALDPRGPKADAGEPFLFSVILPVRDGHPTIGTAIQSVRTQSYARWELILIDDGSAPPVRETIALMLDDTRIRLIETGPQGVSAARNRGLQEAKGEVVAYLDCDNVWFLRYLEDVATQFARNPGRDAVYHAQLVHNRRTGLRTVRYRPFDMEALGEGNYIDLNAFAHRRTLVDRVGGFDESLPRLGDWDFITRCSREQPPLHSPRISGRYIELGKGSITERLPYWYYAYRIRRGMERKAAPSVRVLYAVWHYPQLTESYVRWEIDSMLRLGMTVEVFAEEREVAASYPSAVPVHYGDLEAAVRSFRPDVIHVHWLNFVEKFRGTAARLGVPMTAKAHGFEWSPDLAQRLAQDLTVAHVYVFPHLRVESARPDVVRTVRSSFNADLYFPPKQKNRALVVRTGAGLLSKDYRTFIETAKRCPAHRFVLVLGRAFNAESQTDEIVAMNREAGGPVEIRVDLAAEEVAALVREAGIYLHTFGFESPFGMPVSIAEAMAAGCFVLCRPCEGSRIYVGNAGAFYDTAEHAAAIIHETARWPDHLWEAFQWRAVEHAYEHHNDLDAYAVIREDWQRLVRHRVLAGDHSPLLDERFNPLLDFLLNEGMDRMSHHHEAFINHQVRVGRILLSWGSDLPVCLAGVAHSMYGTERGGTGFDRSRKAELQTLIGASAERLVDLNCRMSRSSLDRRVLEGAAGDVMLTDRFDGKEIRVSGDEFDELCRMQLADWLDQVSRSGLWHVRRNAYWQIAARLGGNALQDFQTVYGLKSPEEPRI